MPSREGDQNIMVDALAMALLALFAKRGATSLRAPSNRDGQPPFMHAFRTAFQSAYCVQALRPLVAHRTLASWSLWPGQEARPPQGTIESISSQSEECCAGHPGDPPMEGASLRSCHLGGDQNDRSEEGVVWIWRTGGSWQREQ